MSIAKLNRIARLILGLVLIASVSGQPQGFLKVKILEGDGAFNDIKRKIGHAVSVEVRDENNQPVSGAEVTFMAPEWGPSGTFSNGKRTVMAITNMEGVAQVEALRPNVAEGRFNITVTARLSDREGSAMIGQSNSTAIVVPRGSHK